MSWPASSTSTIDATFTVGSQIGRCDQHDASLVVSTGDTSEAPRRRVSRRDEDNVQQQPTMKLEILECRLRNLSGCKVVERVALSGRPIENKA
eukprot:scaffold72199_cov33-Prasinocladus_malaysianus.AAC.1